jgi:hypothetical protein
MSDTIWMKQRMRGSPTSILECENDSDFVSTSERCGDGASDRSQLSQLAVSLTTKLCKGGDIIEQQMSETEMIEVVRRLLS